MSRRIHIYPLPDASIPPGDFDPPLRHVEQTVDPETWDRIQGYQPPAFTGRKPADPLPPASVEDAEETPITETEPVEPASEPEQE
jgi:hypothetical protein